MTEPKKTLDVYRDAAREYGGGSGEGCAGFIAICLGGLGWWICHLFGWFGL